MPKLLLLALLVLTVAAVPSYASVVAVTGGPTQFEIEARARNGRTGFEAVLFTPGNPSPGNAATQLNPRGAPVWIYDGNGYDFAFNYTAATGASSFAIDFNRDGDYLDNEELALSSSPNLVGKGFRYFNVFGQGNGVRDAAIFSLTINDDSMDIGDFNTAGASPDIFSQSWTDSSGLFGDVNVTGIFAFSGSANDERPRVWFRLGEAVPLPLPEIIAPTSFRFASIASAVVPEPQSWALLVIGFGGIGSVLRRRRPALA